jgi:hypothetical protein
MEETIVSEFVLVATRKISEILPAVFGILWIFSETEEEETRGERGIMNRINLPPVCLR